MILKGIYIRERGSKMGFYLNPGNDGFLESICSRIYVDKTGLAACTNELINTEEKYVCISRPRRFGKSLNLDMLKTFFEIGSNASYTGCSIELKYAENGAFDAACAEALEQISENKYIDYLKQEGMKTIYAYAVACFKKNCKIICQH